MKRAYLTIASGLVVSALMAGQALAGSAGSLPQAKLAGNWAGHGSATFALCFTSGFGALSDCSTAVETAMLTETWVNQGTIDKSGNSCFTTTLVNGVEFPAPTTKGFTETVIQVTKTTSYDPTTGTGAGSVTNYIAGAGTACNGSTLVNTANAPVDSTGTVQVVFSEKGNRADAVSTSFQPAGLKDETVLVDHTELFRQ